MRARDVRTPPMRLPHIELSTGSVRLLSDRRPIELVLEITNRRGRSSIERFAPECIDLPGCFRGFVEQTIAELDEEDALVDVFGLDRYAA